MSFGVARLLALVEGGLLVALGQVVGPEHRRPAAQTCGRPGNRAERGLDLRRQRGPQRRGRRDRRSAARPGCCQSSLSCCCGLSPAAIRRAARASRGRAQPGTGRLDRTVQSALAAPALALSSSGGRRRDASRSSSIACHVLRCPLRALRTIGAATARRRVSRRRPRCPSTVCLPFRPIGEAVDSSRWACWPS